LTYVNFVYYKTTSRYAVGHKTLTLNTDHTLLLFDHHNCLTNTCIIILVLII